MTMPYALTMSTTSLHQRTWCHGWYITRVSM